GASSREVGMDIRSKLLLLLAISFGYVTEISAVEKRIARADLPPEVQKRVEVEERTAKVLGFSQEREGNRVSYEIELVENGNRKDVLLDTNGEILEIEEEIPFESLPSNTQSILQETRKYGRVEKMEKLIKGGNLVFYEVEVMKNGKRSEFKFGP